VSIYSFIQGHVSSTQKYRECFNNSSALSTVRLYLSKSDHGNLIGGGGGLPRNSLAETARRRKPQVPATPRSSSPELPLPLSPFLLLLLQNSTILASFSANVEASFLKRWNDASRLFVIREAAGEISRRSASSASGPVSAFFVSTPPTLP